MGDKETAKNCYLWNRPKFHRTFVQKKLLPLTKRQSKEIRKSSLETGARIFVIFGENLKYSAILKSKIKESKLKGFTKYCASVESIQKFNFDVPALQRQISASLQGIAFLSPAEVKRVRRPRIGRASYLCFTSSSCCPDTIQLSDKASDIRKGDIVWFCKYSDVSRKSLSSLRVSQLKQILKTNLLPVSGKKSKLIERILQPKGKIEIIQYLIAEGIPLLDFTIIGKCKVLESKGLELRLAQESKIDLKLERVLETFDLPEIENVLEEYRKWYVDEKSVPALTPEQNLKAIPDFVSDHIMKIQSLNKVNQEIKKIVEKYGISDNLIWNCKKQMFVSPNKYIRENYIKNDESLEQFVSYCEEKEKEFILRLSSIIDRFGAKHLSALTPFEFERAIEGLLNKLGFSDVKTTSKVRDDGFDLSATLVEPFKRGKFIIECKRWEDNVGVDVVRKLLGVVTSQGQRATKGILVTTSDFTPEAREFAKENEKNLEIISGKELRELLRIV